MKLLLTGSRSMLTDRLISTAYKAGWEIYLLVGSTTEVKKPPRVFEQYVFPYDNECIRDVVGSVEPDVVLFTGAFDGSFDWDEPGRASVYYISSLFNLLNISAQRPGTRFVLLSSDEVFRGAEEPMAEDAAPSPSGELGRLLTQGETMCLNHGRMSGMETTVIRLDHLYGIPLEPDEVLGRLEGMCLDALKNGAVSYRDGGFSSLYVNDAVDGIYRIMSADSRKRQVYHLSSEEVVEERAAAEKIASLLTGEHPLKKVENESGCEAVLSDLCVREEFGFHIFHRLSTALPKVCESMDGGAQRLLTREERARRVQVFSGKAANRGFFVTAIPYIVSLVCALLFYWANGAAGQVKLFGHVDFCLIYVMIFSGIYGKRHAVLSACLSVALTLFFSDGIFAMMLDYGLYIWIAQIFIVGMLIGHMRDHLDMALIEKEEEREYLQRLLREQEEIHGKTRSIKRQYESRLISYDGSLGRIYDITAKLNSMDPGDVLFCAASTTAELMDSRDVAIYLVSNQRYCRLFSSTSEKARSLGKSVAYADIPGIREALAEKRVFINREMNMALPVMVNGIYDGERLTVIIMVWGMPLENVTLHQANTLNVVSSLIMMAMNRANTYMASMVRERMLDGTSLMEPAAFDELRRLYRSAAARQLASYTILRVEGEAATPEEWGQRLGNRVRNTDNVGFLAQDAVGGGKWVAVCILLPNTNETEAQLVSARMGAASLSCVVMETEEQRNVKR